MGKFNAEQDLVNGKSLTLTLNLTDNDIEAIKVRLFSPRKSMNEINQFVERKMQLTYQIKKIIYKEEGIANFTKPADNGLFGDVLLTMEQANRKIELLNSSVSFSANGRKKRAGDLLYVNSSNTLLWPVGKPIPFGFDPNMSEQQRATVRTCIKDITSKTCVRFTELTNLNGKPPNISSIYFLRYSTTSYYGIPYHYDSIMHYASSTSARSYPLKTMTAKIDPVKNDRLMGQRKGLSQSDVDAINKLYCYPKGSNNNEYKDEHNDKGNDKYKKKRLINGIDEEYYAPNASDAYTPHEIRRIMRFFCTENPKDKNCKPEWIITDGEKPTEPLGVKKDKKVKYILKIHANTYNVQFPKFKKYVKKPPPKYKIIDPTVGIPKKFKNKLPHVKAKKLSKKDIDAIKKNCVNNTCMRNKDEHKHCRASFADYEMAMHQNAYPSKSIDDLNEFVETKMQRTYEIKKIIYKKEGIDNFVKPADNGLFGDVLLTMHQADGCINQLNSGFSYSHVVPNNNISKRRKKRAGDLLYFNSSTTHRWPIGKPIPYGFDPNMSEQQRATVRTCIKDITSKTCVRFTELTNLNGKPPNISSIYFIRYITTAYCGITYVGVNKPYNPIFLTFLCPNMVGVACHEIMHTLGAQHEHLREDRDDNINILWDNIDPQSLDDFVLSDSSVYSSYGIPYHYDSIMHYGSAAGARSYPLKTMTAKIDPVKNDPLMGQRKGLSQSDVDAINKLYCYPKECSDISNFCGTWATQGLCYCGSTGRPDCYMLQNCRNSCNFCNCTSYYAN
ncbi:Metalloendopeptidase [Meloidogyne graminicola]|uniref:Metalloendopeptidase n=1 Tax=Meloidogyne graminicola TaxID=189291 RepID=A0A8S9ZUY3_9BILA|nr:Metalloendopeptidase [Meloidogyne graminicola]